MKTQRVAVNSTAILSVGYNTKKSTLHIVFTNGVRYVYKDVAVLVALELVSAYSIGKYFNRNIKGIYSFTRKGA